MAIIKTIGIAEEHDTAMPITSSGGAQIGADVKESVNFSDSVDAHIIPSSSRATHYSLNDTPSKTDSIGFDPYIKALAKMLLHEKTKTPIVVGIYGEWGSGKSSFMHLLMKEIQTNLKTEQTKTYNSRKGPIIKQGWFNAWKYDNKGDLWTAMLIDISMQLEAGTCLFTKIQRRLQVNNIIFGFAIFISLIFLIYSLFNFSYSAAYDFYIKSLNLEIPGYKFFPNTLSILLIFLFIPYQIFKFCKKFQLPLGLDIAKLADAQNLTEKVENIRNFDERFKKKLDDYLTKNGRLIVYIDDLDRCSPGHVVDVIEAINLFLDTDRCIFILGMDLDLVSKAIESKYKDISENYNSNLHDKDKINRNYGKKFIEKIIQIPISIPEMTHQELSTFFNVITFSKKTEDNLEQPINSKNKIEIEDIDFPISIENEEFIKTLLPYLEKRPREIKRFYNMLTLIHFFYYVNKDNLGSISELGLTLWFFIKYKFPKLLSTNDFMGWDDLIHYVEQEEPMIHTFFKEYELDNEKLINVMKDDTAKIKEYELITRFLNV